MSTNPPVWAQGVGRILMETVDSTNAEALRQWHAVQRPAWVLAGEQTAGRGRRGRAWASPRGNFHGTLVMQPEGPPAQVALRSFVAALALRDAFIGVSGLAGSFALKWPNDVLLNGGKVAGILLESSTTGPLCVGIGVNLIAAPDAALIEAGAVPPVTLLAETGLRITPEGFLAHLAPAFERWNARLESEGFAPLRTAFLDHAARLGETIRARTGSETREGRFETIDETGALVLIMTSGRISIPAAEVFF